MDSRQAPPNCDCLKMQCCWDKNRNEATVEKTALLHLITKGQATLA